jgi:CubicO group peptidase (beta-lactamase class C family)
MSKSKQSLLFIFTLFILFLIGCTEKKSVKIKKKSELPYAINPREDELPILSANYIQDKKNKIEHFVANNWSSDFENISFLVAQNGQIIYEKYEGFADKENNILNAPETPLHIASVSKVVTACAILKLIDTKKIGLNDKLTTYFEGFPYENVTIKTLLNHRSGIKKYGYFADDKANWDRKNTLTNNDVLQLLTSKKIPLEYKTDTHFSYCNTNYVLLALVIEKVTGMKYRNAIQKMIFEPLEMKNSFVFDEETPK